MLVKNVIGYCGSLPQQLVLKSTQNPIPQSTRRGLDTDPSKKISDKISIGKVKEHVVMAPDTFLAININQILVLNKVIFSRIYIIVVRKRHLILVHKVILILLLNLILVSEHLFSTVDNLLDKVLLMYSI